MLASSRAIGSESDSEGGSVEGDVWNDDGGVGGRAGGLCMLIGAQGDAVFEPSQGLRAVTAVFEPSHAAGEVK